MKTIQDVNHNEMYLIIAKLAYRALADGDIYDEMALSLDLSDDCLKDIQESLERRIEKMERTIEE